MEPFGPFTLTVPAYPATEVTVETSQVHGMIFGVGVKYTVDDVVTLAITTKGNFGPAQNILTLTDANTDGWFYPVGALVGVDGAAIADQYNVGIPVSDALQLALSGAVGEDVVEVVFLIEP